VKIKRTKAATIKAILFCNVCGDGYPFDFIPSSQQYYCWQCHPVKVKVREEDIGYRLLKKGATA
jgi:hypothetical protein